MAIANPNAISHRIVLRVSVMESNRCTYDRIERPPAAPGPRLRAALAAAGLRPHGHAHPRCRSPALTPIARLTVTEGVGEASAVCKTCV